MGSHLEDRNEGKPGEGGRSEHSGGVAATQPGSFKGRTLARDNQRKQQNKGSGEASLANVSKSYDHHRHRRHQENFILNILCGFFILFNFWDRVSWSPSWLWTDCVTESNHEFLTHQCWAQACATTPSYRLSLNYDLCLLSLEFDNYF